MIRNGELVDMFTQFVILRMDNGISKSEIDNMTFFDFEITHMMITDIQKRRMEKRA